MRLLLEHVINISQTVCAWHAQLVQAAVQEPIRYVTPPVEPVWVRRVISEIPQVTVIFYRFNTK